MFLIYSYLVSIWDLLHTVLFSDPVLSCAAGFELVVSGIETFSLTILVRSVVVRLVWGAANMLLDLIMAVLLEGLEHINGVAFC